MNFMRIKNPELQQSGQMFGPARPKYTPEETEAIDPADLPVGDSTEPVIVHDGLPVDGFPCPVCGFVAKSKIGLIGHSRKHKE